MSNVWLQDASADYSGAAIRLATVVQNKVQRLLFACVELYPHEVSIPPKAAEQRHSGALTLRHSVTPTSVAEAFDWYAQVASGAPVVPNLPTIELAPVTLAPEPQWGRCVVGADPPFEPRWHGGARLHRLVNMNEPLESVGPIWSPGSNPERWEIDRSWLAQRLHFDLLASDEWIGGCALIAPNPVARSIGHRLIRRTAEGLETFRLTADLRSGTSPSGLTLRVVERRVGGFAQVSTHPLDQFGSVEISFPQPIDQLGWDLHCQRRGLLVHGPATPLLRQIPFSISLETGELRVEVPSPKQAGAPTSYARPIVKPVSSSVAGDSTASPGAARLHRLIMRRERRSGSARPSGEQGRLDALIFDRDREAAAAAIRGLIARARRSVTLVDSFFDELALREFALAIPSTGIEIRILTNYRAESRDLDAGVVPMERLDHAIAEAAGLFARHGLATLDVRVAGGEVRRYHDRFLIMDEEAWHCGHSFNQVGRTELSVMTRLRRPETAIAMINHDFVRAERFSDVHQRWLDNEPPPLPRWRVEAAKFLRRMSKKLEERW